MIDKVLIGFLLVFISVQEWQNRKERKRLLDAVMAKDFSELKREERLEKTSPPSLEEKQTPPEYIPVEQATDEEFVKAIKKDLGRESTFEKMKEKLKR